MRPRFRFAVLCLTAAILTACCFTNVYAVDHQNFQASLHFLAGLPQGDFEEAIDDNAYGGGGNFIWTPNRSPIGLGISLGYLNFSSDTRREPFSNTIPDVTVEVNTTNNSFQGHLLLRAQYQEGDLRPYADGLFGFNYLFMETKIQGEDDNEEVVSSTDFDDAALSYGVGGGLLVRVWSGGSAGSPVTLLIDAGARYLIGAEADYARRKDIVDSEVIYDIVRTETDMLMIQVGITANF